MSQNEKKNVILIINQLTRIQMKRTILLFALFCVHVCHAQLDNFTFTIDTLFSKPSEGGFMYFQVPNTIGVGACFDYYKSTQADVDNDMQLMESHIDSLAFMRHFKFQQTYKGIPVEGAGLIEHFDDKGSLFFTNGKLVDDMNHDPNPSIPRNSVIPTFESIMPSGTTFAWLDSQAEQQLRTDTGDSSATYYPVPELIFAVDTMKNMTALIDGSRYRLAYRFQVVTLDPYAVDIYYLDANSGDIIRVATQMHSDGPAEVYGYGSKVIDTEWRGFPHYNHRLFADDATRQIHTKKKEGTSGTMNWSGTSSVTDSDDDWGSTYLTETTTHYFMTRAWDFYKERFGRIGVDNLNSEIRVRTQWSIPNALYVGGVATPFIMFGQSETGWDLGMDASIVGHEYTHGVTYYTSQLGLNYESGALNESYSDIFGIVIHATSLDNGSTDWILGNSISSGVTRSLVNPNSMGASQFQLISGECISQGIGLPDTYLGDFWYDGDCDAGGVHVNNGVQNYWYYLLSAGGSGVNDDGDIYNIGGIGMLKSSHIAYYALTSILQSSAQYADSRLATIEAAKILYGECSIEHQQTINAWYAVGLGNPHGCTYTLDNSEVTLDEIRYYPNPSTSFMTIEMPFNGIKSFTLFDGSGKEIANVETEDFVYHFDTQTYERGMYTIVFNVNGAILTKKIIIQ